MHFFIAYFLAGISKFSAEISHSQQHSGLIKNEKFCSMFFLIKQNFPNFNYFAPKMAGLSLVA